jgi:hypothetical protein
MTNGLVVMTPTSVDVTGTSATINSDGSVSFSAVTELRLNGVFTSDYDNYMITWRGTSSASTGVFARLSVGGVDNSTASSYTRQILNADGTSISAARASYNSFASPIVSAGVQRAGSTVYLFGPYLAQPTALRSVNAFDESSAFIAERAITHNQSISYDGINIYPGTANMTGLLTVFGFNQ